MALVGQRKDKRTVRFQLIYEMKKIEIILATITYHMLGQLNMLEMCGTDTMVLIQFYPKQIKVQRIISFV